MYVSLFGLGEIAIPATTLLNDIALLPYQENDGLNLSSRSLRSTVGALPSIVGAG